MDRPDVTGPSDITRIAVTAGEPAGIGPDLCLQITQRDWPVELVVIADADLLRQRARQLGLDIRIEEFDATHAARASRAGTLSVQQVATATTVIAGRPDSDNAAYVLETLQQAVTGCRQQRFAAMVTAPVHKGIINEAGITFSGHTEYLQQLTNTPQVVMMLVTAGLRVALVTTHVPLRDVGDLITAQRLTSVIDVLDHDLRRRFGISRPRIVVCGLNPHAGEDGHLGREDIDIIVPTLNRLREQGLALTGPLPADTLFIPKYLDDCDVVLAMYHDQGLPVLKYKGFGNAVNITLGLPLIRTSVDHGTALELAGSGQADTGSLRMAIETALTMVKCQNRHDGQAT